MRGFKGIAATCGLLIAVVPTLGGFEGAAAAPSPTPPSPDRNCVLSPSLDYSGGESASCIAVGARLSRVPAVGSTASLKVTVKAARAEAHTRVTIDLPPSLAFADGTPTTAAVNGAGPVSRADAGELALDAGSSHTFTRTVRAVRAGFGGITVSAQNRMSSSRTDGGTTSVFLTTGATSASSFLGRAASNAPGATARAHYTGAGGEAPPTRSPRGLPATTHPATQVAARPNTAGQACATGRWFYVDQGSVTRPASNVTVLVRNASGTLASGFTSTSDGSYNLCWNTGGNTQTGVYLTFVLSNIAWTVVNLSNGQYNFSTPKVTIADGTTHDFGNMQPGDSTAMRGAHAYQEANDEYIWIYQSAPYIGGCWSPFETTCRQLVIHWQSDSTTGTYWNHTGAYLLAGSPDTLDEPVHEYGHALMYGLYGESFPTTTNCNPHFLFSASSTTCAMTEGWADWVATSVYNNLTWTFNGGSTTSFDVTWNDAFGFATGDQVEGRVVMAMRSLTDGVKAPWDNDPGEGTGIRDARKFFAVLHTYKPNTFSQFWGDRSLAGQDVSQTALSALYQGTIDYGFRNPLTSAVGVHFPEAVPDHNYSNAAPGGFWSVVATRPDSGSDVDLSLFSDSGLTTLAGQSTFGSTATDFVAINSNSGHRPAAIYYPSVHEAVGSGGYTIESVSGSRTLSVGTATASLASTQPVTIFDSFQNVGVPVFYRAVPTAALELELFLTPAASDIVGRGQSVAGIPAGIGAPATLTSTPVTTGYHGLVLTNNGLSTGTVTLYADTSAPTGTVSINSGAANASSPKATLKLSATDTQTGVMAMQISTDGTFDTEPVIPFATNAPVTLPGPNNGTKTVSVRFENNAGMWSTAATDTINLHAKPVITSITPNTGPIAGNQTVTINGSFLNGATAVKFGNKAAKSFTLSSGAKITAVTPAGSAASVNVIVTNPFGSNPNSATNKYTFVGKPTITSINPKQGPHAGGTVVTINGNNFTAGGTVKFGTTSATNVTFVSKTKITAKAPAHAAGTVDIKVTTTGGTSTAVAADKYKYT